MEYAIIILIATISFFLWFLVGRTKGRKAERKWWRDSIKAKRFDFEGKVYEITEV